MCSAVQAVKLSSLALAQLKDLAERWAKLVLAGSANVTECRITTPYLQVLVCTGTSSSPPHEIQV